MPMPTARLPETDEKCEHGDQAEKEEFGQCVDIHKSMVERFTEVTIMEAQNRHPIDRGAAVMVLLPFDRQVEDLVVFFLQEVAAEVKGQAPFHDTGGAVETPLREFDADVTGDIEQCIVQDMGGIPCDPVDEPA